MGDHDQRDVVHYDIDYVDEPDDFFEDDYDEAYIEAVHDWHDFPPHYTREMIKDAQRKDAPKKYDQNKDNENKDNENEEDKINEDGINEDGINEDGINEDRINEDRINGDGINEDGIDEDDIDEDDIDEDDIDDYDIDDYDIDDDDIDDDDIDDEMNEDDHISFPVPGMPIRGSAKSVAGTAVGLREIRHQALKMSKPPATTMCDPSALGGAAAVSDSSDRIRTIVGRAEEGAATSEDLEFIQSALRPTGTISSDIC
ncbi:hypothetical protein E4U59_002699 [Claviceps monticola]|nr:hypothetical protein E4U59_002699 [Claviceps monticola]